MPLACDRAGVGGRSISSAGELPAHADSLRGIQPVRCLLLSNVPQLRSEFILAEDAEAEISIERRVPRDVGEGRERDGRQPCIGCPGAHTLEKRLADASALMTRPNAHLLDVRAVVDNVDEDVADRLIGAVNSDPGPPCLRVSGERLHGSRRVIRDLGQTDISKALASKSFDLSKRRPFRRSRWPDDGGHVENPCTA